MVTITSNVQWRAGLVVASVNIRAMREKSSYGLCLITVRQHASSMYTKAEGKGKGMSSHEPLPKHTPRHTGNCPSHIHNKTLTRSPYLRSLCSYTSTIHVHRVYTVFHPHNYNHNVHISYVSTLHLDTAWISACMLIIRIRTSIAW